MIETTSIFIDKQEEEEVNQFNLYLDLFLRISSKIKDKVCLRGNILLNTLIPEYARATQDLDIDVLGEKTYYSVVLPELEIFAKELVQLGLATHHNVEDLRETGKAGIKIWKDGAITFSVDVNISYGLLVGSIDYTIKGQDTKVSSIEKILADKTITTLTRVRYRRYKDFFDLNAILVSGIKFDYKKIIEALLENHTMDEIGTAINDVTNFNLEAIDKLHRIHDKFKISSFSNKNIIMPEFKDLIDTCGKYYDKLRGYLNEYDKEE